MLTERYIFLAVGAIMAIGGFTMLFQAVRKWTRNQDRSQVVQQRFIGKFLMANVLLHLGMLVVVIAGAGLIVFGLSR